MNVVEMVAWAVLGLAALTLVGIFVGSFLALPYRSRVEFAIIVAVGVVVTWAIAVVGGAL